MFSCVCVCVCVSFLFLWFYSTFQVLWKLCHPLHVPLQVGSVPSVTYVLTVCVLSFTLCITDSVEDRLGLE